MTPGPITAPPAQATAAPRPATASPVDAIAAGQRARTLRLLAVTLTLAAIVATLWWIEVAAGNTWYAAADILAVMRGENVPGVSFAVGQLRLPRAIVALLVGLALGISGRASQTLLRNELASPDIIGITSGASASAIVALLVFNLSGVTVSIIALTCGLACALLVFVLAGPGSAQGGRLILIGIGLSAVAMAVTNYVILRANVWDVSDALRWLSGSLSAATWDHVPVLAVAVVALVAVMVAMERDLRALRLGDEAAAGLGVPVTLVRLAVFVCIFALAAFAAAATGPMMFVAFLSGPITVRIVGTQDNTLLIPSALMGAVLVLGADLAGQHAFPATLPVGVVTGLVGAPYLILTLIRFNQSGASS